MNRSDSSQASPRPVGRKRPWPSAIRQPSRIGILSVIALVVLLFLGGGREVAVWAADAPMTGDTNRPFRMAIMTNMFTQVNESDARAAMKVWIMTVARERGILVESNMVVCRSVEDLVQVCRSNLVDGVGLQVPEYFQSNLAAKFDRFAAAVNGGSITEEYVLLVRADGGVERIEQLRGRNLNVLYTPRMSLAMPWLDTLLLKSRQPRALEFFDNVTMLNNATRVALPVFFGKIDACLITRNSFKILGELNPQVEKQLRVLASSPGLVPSGFAFRLDVPSPAKTQLLNEMSRLNESPAGQQILTLTQAERIEDRPVSCLDSALELLGTHARLCGTLQATAVLREETAKSESSP